MQNYIREQQKKQEEDSPKKSRYGSQEVTASKDRSAYARTRHGSAFTGMEFCGSYGLPHRDVREQPVEASLRKLKQRI